MLKPQIILGIETSCDETAAAVCKNTKDGVKILSNIVTSSASLQAKYRGILPEQAAREQLKSIIPVIETAINDSRLKINDLNAIAVTQGPGLIGSLLVGVETAKTLALVWNKPFIPVNHLIGHFYANWINQSLAISLQLSDKKQKKSDGRLTIDDYPSFPCLGLLVSGGHTDLVLFTDRGKHQYLGGTRDDAAGECFDKCARLLNLPYPGGPNLSKLAEKGDPKAYQLPRPMIDSDDLDFSFSGLKTTVFNLITNLNLEKRGVTRAGEPHAGAPRLLTKWETRGAGEWQDPELITANIAASIEDAITDVLVEKSLRAIQTYKVDQFIIAGGVAANKTLAKKLTLTISKIRPRVRLFIPLPSFCTDNAVFIATAAFFNFKPIDPLKLQANPNLSLSD